MKILFIFTGGTIGSTADGEIIFIDNEKPYLLLEKYGESHNIDFEYKTVEPFSALSENNTGDELKKLCQCVKDHLNEDFDGIVVTHGTDTLQYSAASLSYISGNSSIPVCLVSSNFIIEDERSNAIENLHGAVEFIKRGKEKGVWVAYKNTGDFIRIHRATRLLSGKTFSDDVFSVRNEWYGYFDESMSFIENPNYKEAPDGTEPFSPNAVNEQSSKILNISPYVGMSYPEINDEIKYILMGSYHSGTVNTFSESAKNFYKKAHEKGVKVFLTGALGGKSYESTNSFSELHIIPLYDIAPISAYIKLWLCSDKECDITELMNIPLGGDR